MSRRSWQMTLFWAGCAVACTAALASTEAQPPTLVTNQVEQLNYAGLYTDAEVSARALLPQIERQTGPDSLAIAAVLDLLVEALRLGGKSSLPETRELADRALAIREAQLGTNDPLIADSLLRKADVLLEMDSYAMAGALLSRALQIYESSPSSNEISVARVHNRLGKRFLHTGPRRDSEWHSALAVGIAESASKPDELALAEMLTGLAEFHIHSLSGDYRTTAEPLARRALEIRRRVLPEDHPLVAQSLYLYGFVLHDLHRYQESFELMRTALESLEESLGPDHPLVGHYLFGIHHLQEIRGNPVGAEESLWRSISIFEEYPEIGLSAHTYGAMGHLRHQQGDLVSARQLYEKALGITERAFGPGCIEAAWLLNNLGRLETDLGELEDARLHLEQALQIAVDLYGIDGEHTAGHYVALSALDLATGDLEQAEKLARRACEINECATDPGTPKADVAARALGIVLRERGWYEEAREVLSRGLLVRKPGLDVPNHDVAENLIALADLIVVMGAESQAIPIYEEAVSILERLHGRQNPRAASTRLKIADAWIHSGQWAEAFEHAIQAEEVAREHSRLMLTGLSERVALQYAANRPSGLDRVLSLLIDRPESGTRQQGIEALIRSRALVVDEMADRRQAFSTSAAMGTSRLMQDLTRSRKRLAYLTVQGPGAPDALDSFTLALGNARRERDRTERALAEADRRFRIREQGKGVGLDEVKASLPPRSGLLGFTQFQHFRIPGNGRAVDLAAEPVPSYLAYVVRADSTKIELVELGVASDIDALVTELRAELEREAQTTLGSSAAREQDYRGVAKRLRERLWEPIESYLAGLERVFVVPDGSLHLINLAALPVGQTDYLAEVGPRLHYLSAERDLVREVAEVKGEGLLAIGNPDFDELAHLPKTQEVGIGAAGSSPVSETDQAGMFRGLRSTCGSFQAMRFEPLPASEIEVQEVAEIWQSLEPSPPVTTLLRGEAIETSFKRLATGRQVLHLSTHGFYLGDDCPVHDFPHLRRTAVELESPLLRSGLAFAGANHRQAALPEEDDGILTAEEVAALDLFGVEWAVLSACESGLGDIQTGEGVFGLRRAFAAAGARTLIMSLWPVDDDVTREWMTRLYQYRFLEGSTTIEAVHRTNLHLLAARREAGASTHPFYWAGFVAAGEWR